MKTIRITAISTEKARSRTHERAPQTPDRLEDGTGDSTFSSSSGMACYAIIDAFPALPFPEACRYLSKVLSTGSGTAPSFSARSWNSARLKLAPLACLYSSRTLSHARQPTKYIGSCADD